MDFPLAQRVGRIKPSPTLAVTAKAAELKAKGLDVLSLGAGEPDFDTPEHIKNAAREALTRGFTKYTPVGGTPGLKKAIVDKLKRDNDLDYSPAQILVSCGGKQSCYNLCMAFLNATDEVLIPAPYWVSYPDMVLLADATPVILPTSAASRFKISAEQLERAITPRTRMLWLNSPSNPSGMAYSAQELAELGAVLRRHPQILIASDDMYEKILWTGEPYRNIVNVCPDLYERTVIVHAVSKTYSMTGWRIGFAAGPKKLITAMADIQSQSTSNPNSIAQVAAEAALAGDQSCVTTMCEAFKRRHDRLVADLNTVPGIECLSGDGTFYVFPKVEGLMKTLGCASDLELSDKLLAEALVALVPGSAFGTPGHVRLSFATSDAVLAQSVERLRKIAG
ncbi:MAG TPA: pyridoxal phosphate-dependent aminotransferase [Nevskiaceae bacterium]|nr:pyridoxal phosphate-dependent aminotransferase [Nevskiaceae bacterium]